MTIPIIAIMHSAESVTFKYVILSICLGLVQKGGMADFLASIPQLLAEMVLLGTRPAQEMIICHKSESVASTKLKELDSRVDQS